MKYLHFFMLTCLLIVTSINAQSINSVDSLLNTIKQYKYNESRAAIAELYDITVSEIKNGTTKQLENKYLNFLSSKASIEAKNEILRQLSLFATEASIPTLIESLNNMELSDMSLYALSRINGKKVDEVLTNQLEKNDNKIGIINALGYRKAENSILSLSKYLSGNDNSLADAAASALGKIATKKAYSVLEKHTSYMDAILNCLESISKTEKEFAVEEYYKLLKSNTENVYRERIVSAILLLSDTPTNDLIKFIKSYPEEIKKVAIYSIHNQYKILELNKIAELYPSLSNECKILLLHQFAQINNSLIKNYALADLNTKDVNLKMALIKSLQYIGNNEEVDTLIQLITTESGDIKKACITTLKFIPDTDVNKKLVKLLNDSAPKVIITALNSLSDRAATEAFPAILLKAKHQNKKIRAAAYSALSSISTSENFEELLNLLVNLEYEKDLPRIERMLASIILTYPDFDYTTPLLEKIQIVDSIDKEVTIIKVLGRTGSSKAYNLILTKIESSKPNIKIAAVKGLTNFPNAIPIDKLKEIITTSNNKKILRIAYLGYAEMLTKSDLTNDDKLKEYKFILANSDDPNTMNTALANAGSLRNFASLELLGKYVNTPSVKSTVENGIIGISWALLSKEGAKLKKKLIKIKSITNDDNYKSRLDEMIQRSN